MVCKVTEEFYFDVPIKLYNFAFFRMKYLITGHIGGNILKFSVPLMAGNLFQ
jgi:hypothetical protein